jgi:parallel beta-helix repeat protein
VSITLIGAASANITTEADGNYTFTGLQNGLYTVTPSKEGYAFAPSTHSVTVNNVDMIGQDFIALIEVPTSTINLPRTGQTTSYAAEDDGDIRAGVPWPSPRFAVNGDCVTDNLTGLMWPKNANLESQKTWQQALDYVASINGGAGLCGYSDWRLPNVNELESLVNAEQADTGFWLNGEGFINAQLDSCYWSSTTAMMNLTGYAWYVCSRGDVIPVDKSNTISVIPVRNGQTGGIVSLPQTGQKTIYAERDDGDLEKGVEWPDPRFIESGDCVTDNLTGLMWPKNATLSNAPKTWQQSLDYVASMNSGTGLCGYHDWRLPNRKELRSLIDYSKSYPALPEGHPFTDVQSGNNYWSSTTFAVNTGDAWNVHVWGGSLSYANKSDAFNIWPVRGDTSLYVDAVNGNDLGPGTSNEPFKTITHALSADGSDKTIKVRPGTYDAALGEVFPLVLQPGQILIGDEINKGDGAAPTLIVGHGGSIPGGSWSATIVGAEGSRISGFKVGENSYVVLHAAIVADGITMEITNNTFKTLTYAGILLQNKGAPVIENNLFDTDSYGLYILGCPDGPTIRNNIFLQMSIPIDILGIDTYAVIINNTITGNGQVGISVQHGYPLIASNTFKASTGYNYGAIAVSSSSATPKIRENGFACTTAIIVESGNPDIGTVSEHGNNNFNAVAGASLTHNGTATVYAIGNTWPSTMPVCGTDIVPSAGGVVIWGSGTAEHCP